MIKYIIITSIACLSFMMAKEVNAAPVHAVPIQVPSALQGDMAYITLTRFAEQQLYSPKRLLSNPYHINLINSYVAQRGKVSKDNWFYGLFIDHATANMPWAQWTGGSHYVTAVLIRNQLPESLDLTHNIVNLCGRDQGVWQSVTFYPSWHLGKAGQRNDSTVAFLVSNKPFSQAIKACEGA